MSVDSLALDYEGFMIIIVNSRSRDTVLSVDAVEDWKSVPSRKVGVVVN